MASFTAVRRQHGSRTLLILAGYLLLTLGLTYPLVRQFGHAIPGDSFDGWQNYWNLWWMKQAVLVEHTHPWFTDLLYYPTGVSLLFHTLNAFNGFTFLSIQLAWGLFQAYNSVVIFSFAVGGLGAYLLARYVLGTGSSRLAAFAAGIIFTFSPYHIAHLLGHMQLMTLEWVPFYALYLLRTVDGLAKTGGRRLEAGDAPHFARHVMRPIWHDGLMAAFFLVLVTHSDWYYLLYSLIFTALVVVWAAWQIARRRSAPIRSRPHTLAPLARLLATVLGIGLIWTLLLAPILVPMIRETRRSSFMVPDPAQSRTLSADLLAFVTPQEFHPLWGAWAREHARAFTATVSEHQVFAGFTVLALAMVGIWINRRGARERTAPPGGSIRSSPGLWVLTLLTFFILALGPVLHVAGQTALLPGGREIPLPYGWLVRVIPFMDISRSVSRFDAMVMLALAVLAAWGMDWLARRSRGGMAIAVAATALVVFEFLPAPYPMSASDTPAWYTTLAADPRPGAVLNLPMNWDRPGYLLYQTEHGKPLATAYISRDDPRTLAERAPVLQHFRHLGPDIIAFDLAGQGRQVLADLGVRWVVLDRYKMPGGREREYTEAMAGVIFDGQSPAYQDDRLAVYEVTPPQAAAPYLILDAGWGPFDKDRRTRSFTGSASAIVQAPAAGQVSLRVTVAPGSAALDLPQEDDAYVIRTAVQPGANTITFGARSTNDRVEVTSLALTQ